ncbi:guanylate kinase isoform X4 [Parasteatoda tepidariorum]|uniref:guanylate kinase isoform X4 n=1 Tax=Parasteatoda tepidariorum TaxID=114398 RepID=UPI00077FD913|nr:guanylate kinase isoform X2 [Parasteatoda tepidariorum]
MIVNTLTKLVSSRKSFISLLSNCEKNITTSLKLLSTKYPMDTGNSFITNPYENGIVDFKKGNLKWYTKETDSSLPRPVVICGPSGSGKSTLLGMLMAEYKDCIEFSISHTTRSPRPGEKHGQHYYFVDKSEIEDAIARGGFLEYTEFSGNYYGTSKSEINRIQNKGKLCFLDLEINGVKNIRKTSLKPRFIFIKPPSLEVLEERLRGRNTETEESLRKRLNRAKEELVYGEAPGNFDFVIVNDDAEKACEELKNYLRSDLEMLKNQNQ